jgi:aminoglycoside/choline kinase family phosphotransferase
VIDEFVKAQPYSIPVATRYEPIILGTGGAIKNVEDFWDNAPFLVINGDIFTNIDFEKAYQFHLNHKHPVTLMLHDFAQFNHVWMDSNNHVKGFGHTAPCPPAAVDSSDGTAGAKTDAANEYQVAFTGIHVLDPLVLSFIPKGTFYSIIEAYCEMIHNGLTIKGYVARSHYWHDIGTMEGYRAATREALGGKAFKAVYPEIVSDGFVWSKLEGDGSDRIWYRLTKEKDSLIVVDHGPPPNPDVCEADAFAAIGRHLHDKGIPVPRIFAYDRPSGLVVLEDLGDLHLQSLVWRAVDTEEVAGRYRAVIDLLIAIGLEGAKGFDPRYAYQTPYYDRELILEKESRYFVEAFLNGYLGLSIEYETLKNEFEVLAERALEHPYTGLLHRDFQSRNILVEDGRYYVIDFQGARFGPLQYDLASLLIDPYVELPRALQLKLLNYYLKRLSDFIAVDAHEFLDAYVYCAMNRNLQILGAFGFLTRVKGKKDFETYIPPAISSLKARLRRIEQSECPKLSKIIQSI